jgi:hypothetical protein
MLQTARIPSAMTPDKRWHVQLMQQRKQPTARAILTLAAVMSMSVAGPVTVLMSGEPQGGIKMRRRSPDPSSSRYRPFFPLRSYGNGTSPLSWW